jgi:hypothetical protein
MNVPNLCLNSTRTIANAENEILALGTFAGKV